ncbi:MAG: hypothetical protein ACRCZP_14540, partial [Phycicoccus sp.]
WETLDLSPIADAVGSCRLVYPAGAPGFTDLYTNVAASPQRDQEIEVWTAGSAAHRTRWLLQQKTGDELTPGERWVFDGVGLESLLGEALVGPQPTETKELQFTGATYGTMLITALQQAQQRTGVLVGVTWDFTTTTDSRGAAWTPTISDIAFAPDDTVLAIAEAGPAEVLGEFAMGPDRVLHAYNPGTRGVDRTTGGNPLRLQAGANLSEAARRESSRPGDAATAALAKGAEGVYQWATDATAQAQRGRRVEAAVDAGQVASTGGVLAAAQGQLEVLKRGQAERTHGVVFGPGLPIPGVDYDLGDLAFSVTNGVVATERITQWTLRFVREGRARGTVRTNTRIRDRLDRLARELERMRRGKSVVGTSTPRAEVDDGKAPAQVLGVTASSSAYRDADGATQAVVLAAWSAVTTNADATAADDIVGYLPQFRYTGGGLPTGWQPLPQVDGTSVDFDGVVAGQSAQMRVAAVDRWGRAGAFSTAYSLVTGADATPPPTPSTPVVESYLGVLTIEWDGKGSAGEVQPPDFSHLEIHASTSSGFTPSRPLNPDGTLNELTSTTYLDRLSGAGTLPSTIGNYGDTYYAKLVAVDRSGNASAASAQDSALLVQAGDGDVSALSIGKLTAGIMSALMTVSGIIRTAASGSRVELDTDGFRCFLGANKVLDFSIPTAALTLVGTISTGISGRRVVVSGTGNDIRFFPQVGETRFGQISSYVPGNYPNDVAVEIKASDADTLDVVSRINVLPDFVSMGVQDQANNTQSWSRFFANRTALFAQIFSSPGVRSADLSLDTGLNELSTRRVDQTRSTWLYTWDDGNNNPGSLSFRARAGFPDSTHYGEVFVDNNFNSFIGTVAPGTSQKWGMEYVGSNGFINLRTTNAIQVTDQNVSAWRPIRASAFEVNSSAEVKNDFEELPEAALDVLRRSPIARYHRDGDPEGVTQMGPVAEDLPAWLVRPRSGPAVNIVQRPGRPRRRVDPETGTEWLDEGPPELVEEPATLPDSERLDLLSYVAVLAAAVRELDAELDEYRRERRRPVPTRRSTADLLADIRAGRLRPRAAR